MVKNPRTPRKSIKEILSTNSPREWIKEDDRLIPRFLELISMDSKQLRSGTVLFESEGIQVTEKLLELVCDSSLSVACWCEEASHDRLWRYLTRWVRAMQHGEDPSRTERLRAKVVASFGQCYRESRGRLRGMADEIDQHHKRLQSLLFAF